MEDLRKRGSYVGETWKNLASGINFTVNCESFGRSIARSIITKREETNEEKRRREE